MCQFNNSYDRFDYASDLENANEFQTTLELLAEAAELGVDCDFAAGFNQSMDQEQVRAIRQLVESAIADAEIDAATTLKPCPEGYDWRHEGDGFRCEGGSHYCTREEIRQYMRDR